MASLSIVSLSSFFSGEQRSISRGENHYKSGHIESFNYHQSIIRGQVQASMKSKSYKVTIYLDYDNTIKSTECECPRGEFKCSHAAALFIHGIHNLSRTDVECSWKKKKATNTIPESASQMFPPSKKYSALRRTSNAEDRSFLYSQLHQYGRFTGLWWIMTPEPQRTKPLPIQTMEELIYCEEFLEVEGQQNQIAYIQDCAKISSDVVNIIANLTKGQRDNPLWHQARKGRLTASNFGCVLKCKRPTPSLIKRLLGEYDLSRVKAVQWGVNTEKEALKYFVCETGLPLEDTGLWLEESGIIGASPDGLVGQNHLLEIKCPYTERNELIQDAVKKDSFCLKKDDEGFLHLKKEHVYWHQVQGQLFLTKRQFCYFVVWTTRDAVTLIVKRDEEWAANIDVLKDFYFFHIFPKIIEGEL